MVNLVLLSIITIVAVLELCVFIKKYILMPYLFLLRILNSMCTLFSTPLINSLLCTLLLPAAPSCNLQSMK